MYHRQEQVKRPVESKVTESSIALVCKAVNALLENHIRDYAKTTAFEFGEILEQITYFLLIPEELEHHELVRSIEAEQPSSTIQDIVERLVDRLLGSSFNYTHVYFRSHILNFFANIIDVDYLTSPLTEYRDKSGRDLAMLILMQMNNERIENMSGFIEKWLRKDKGKLNHRDNFSNYLADYLFCHSFALYENLYANFKNDLIFFNPISLMLSQLGCGFLEKAKIRQMIETDIGTAKFGNIVEPRLRRKLRGEGTLGVYEYRELLEFIKKVEPKGLEDNDWKLIKSVLPQLSWADIEELLKYILAPTAGDLELLLFSTVLKICNPEFKEPIIASIISQGQGAKHLFALFLKSSQAPNISVYFEIFISGLLVSISFPKYHPLHDLLTNPKNLMEKEDIIRILAIQSDNDVNDIELWLLNALIKKSLDSVIDDALETILRQAPLLASNLLQIMFLGLNERTETDYLKTPLSYAKLGLTNKVKFKFQISKAARSAVIDSIGHLFREINASRKRKLEDCYPDQQNLVRFDEKERLTQSALRLQGLMSSQVRTKIHAVHYPNATRETRIFSPQLTNKTLLRRIKSRVWEVHFIQDITHISNSRYLNQVLDQGAFSRFALEKHKIAHVKAALNSAAEPADFDTVCFAIGNSGDVDSCALQNATSSNFPIRLTLDFSKLRSRFFAKGQVFVKEHDLFWTTKPNLEEKRALHTSRRDHKEFARGDIPEEFKETISLGQKQFSFYRNACGIKFMLDDDKYVLHYPYWNNFGIDAYEGQSESEKAESNLQEEVIENNFGQTLFYGDITEIEQFIFSTH